MNAIARDERIEFAQAGFDKTRRRQMRSNGFRGL